MMRFSWIVGLFAAGLFPVLLYAEQEVTLKSGTRLIGSVTFEGDTVVVKIDDAELSVPLSKIDLVAPVGTDSSQSPNRLLMIALESRLQQGSGEGLIGVLAEASRLAPEDPRITYWYARSLLDAGFGEAAQQVFSSQRDAISKIYPGLAEHFAAAIGRRVALAKLPPELVSSIDRLNAATEHRSLDDDEIPTFARFRLVDQHQKPIDKSAFRVFCNGRDEHLESFNEGYYLLSFKRNRNSSIVDCRIEVASPGLESKTIELRTSSSQVENAGDFVIHRYDEQEKLTFQVTVVDSKKKPLPDAEVTLRPSTNSSSSTDYLVATTGPDGKAVIRAFPLSYSYTVEKSGFSPGSGRIKLDPNVFPTEQRVDLYPLITGKLRVAWIGSPLQPEGVNIAGDSILTVSTGMPRSGPYGPDAVNFIRPVQSKNEITLQIGQPHRFGMREGLVPWVHRISLDAKGDDASVLVQFQALDLKQIEEIKKTSSPAEVENRLPGPPGILALPIKQGQVYVGQVVDRDMRTGQPMVIAFKVFVEELSNASP